MVGRGYRAGRALLALIVTAAPAFAQDYPLVWPSELRPATLPAWQQATPGPRSVDTSENVVPGATEVLKDVPNVFSWSRFQSGRIGGFDYRLFPDGSAIVIAAEGRPFAQYMLSCRKGDACEIANDAGVILIVPAIGAPKPPLPPDDVDGLGVAQYLARWILAGTGTPPPPPPQPEPAPEPQGPPLPDVLPVTEPEPEAVVPPEPAQNNLLPTDADCLEPDPFYPDACEPVAPEPAPPAPQPVAARAIDIPAPVAPVQPAPEPAPMTLAERYRLSCSLSTGAGLKYTDHVDFDDAFGKLRVTLGCNARLNDRVSLSLALVRFPLSGQQAPWDPDFTYAVNMRVTEKLGLSYSNYGARFSGGGNDLVSSLLKGSLRASYKLPTLHLPFQKEAACSVSIGLSNPGNDSGSLSCGMSVTDKLRVGLTLYAYPANRQKPWNPDYSYTASYRLNDRVTLNYSNYSANRWPWNRGPSPGPGLLGGSVSLSYKLMF
ncbi:hypothetical protein [Paracoccus zeaxanthinifaciens]|uniref:hypothetical protein n=1 Tax=Paracoccus zeaxanthinifaciens TaxID=187400 RepID=UPI0003B367EB|nr:hypothetical protein [Paracoccus zeaxanthinifaciens]